MLQIFVHIGIRHSNIGQVCFVGYGSLKTKMKTPIMCMTPKEHKKHKSTKESIMVL
jgi:hypothetical protein